MSKVYVPKTPVTHPCRYCRQLFTKLGLARHTCPTFSSKFPPIPERRSET